MRPRKQPDAADAYKLEIALTGSSADNRWPAFEYRDNLSAQREYWEANRQGILKDWISRHPGTRPAAWWLHEAPGLRLKLSADGPDNDALREMGGRSFFGIPSHYLDPFEVEQDNPVFETETQFLKRNFDNDR